MLDGTIRRDNEEAPEGPNGVTNCSAGPCAGCLASTALAGRVASIEMLPAVPRPGDFQRRWWLTGLIVDIVPPFGSKDSEATMLAR